MYMYSYVQCTCTLLKGITVFMYYTMYYVLVFLYLNRCAGNRMLRGITFVKRQEKSGAADLLLSAEATANQFPIEFTVEISKWTGKRYSLVLLLAERYRPSVIAGC